MTLTTHDQFKFESSLRLIKINCSKFTAKNNSISKDLAYFIDQTKMPPETNDNMYNGKKQKLHGRIVKLSVFSSFSQTINSKSKSTRFVEKLFKK